MEMLLGLNEIQFYVEIIIGSVEDNFHGNLLFFVNLRV